MDAEQLLLGAVSGPGEGAAMIARFFKESAIYATGGLLSQGITFLLFPFLAHVFSPHDYGVIDILALAATLVNLTVALEIGQGLGREVSELGDDKVQWREYASTAMIFTIGMYTGFAIVTLILAVPITHALLDYRTSPWVVRVEIAVIWFNGLVYVGLDQLRWHKRAGAFTITSIALAAGATLTTAGLVLGFGMGVIAAIIGQLVGMICAVVALFALSREDYGLCFEREKCVRMLRYSLPLVLSSIGVFLNGFADRIAIQHTRNLAAVGVYGVGFRIATVVSLLLLGFQGAMMPMVLVRHREVSTPAELAGIFRLFCLVGLIAFITLSVFADSEVRLLASGSYARADVVVPYLVLQALLFGAYVFAPGLTIAKNTRVMAGIAVSAGLLNVALAFALVPALGIRGAGIATLISSAWFFALNMRSSQRSYHVPHDWTKLSAAMLVAVAAVAGSRMLLPIGGAHAFALVSLGEKAAITAVAVGLIAAMLVDRSELGVVAQRLLALLQRSAAARFRRARVN